MAKTLNEWQEEIHALAKEKGWWEQERNPLEIHALIHSEIAEATEAARAGLDPAHRIGESGKPEGEAVELADAVIRVLDWFEFNGWDFEAIMESKHLYNKSRPHRHGGKLF